MSFVFMVFHWPEPDHREALARSMAEMRDGLLGMPGCVDVAPPLVAEDGECLVGISTWDAEDAFRAAITLRAADEVVEGETRPRQRFILHEVPPAPAC